MNLSWGIGGNISADKADVADRLNTYFSSIAKTLVNKLQTGTCCLGERKVKQVCQEKGVQADAFSFNEVTETLVLKRLKELDISRAMGLDNIYI